MHLKSVSDTGKSSITTFLGDGSVANVQFELRLVGLVCLSSFLFSLRDEIGSRWRLREAFVVAYRL